jgi:hypothetical protein
MRFFIRELLFIACGACFVACQSGEQRISRRWVFTDLQTPSSKALAKAFDAGLVDELTADLRKKIQGNRMILDKDGKCYGVLLNHYFTGHWDYSNTAQAVFTHFDYPKKADLKWTIVNNSFSKSKFDIDVSKLQQMDRSLSDTSVETEEVSTRLLDQSGIYTIAAESESADFDEKDSDPWSPSLNQWRLKPANSESADEIKKRVRNHLHFMYSFFSFAIRGERYWVSQDWFFSVIKPGNNGTALLSVRNIPSQWYSCFYDSTQAMQGYELLRKAFHEDLKIPKESNSIVFNKLMLEQLLSVYDKP